MVFPRQGQKNDEFYGEDRIRELIKQHHKLSPDKIAYKILQDVQNFSVDSRYTDDRTLVVIKRDREEESAD